MALHNIALVHAVADANRTLEQKAEHPERLVIESVTVSIRRYDEESDEVVKTGRGILYENLNDDNVRVRPVELLGHASRTVSG